MTARLACAMLAAVLLPTLSAAQDRAAMPGAHAMRPAPPLSSPPPLRDVPPPPDVLSSTRPDLFRAAPDTYVAKPQDELGLFFPQVVSPWPVWGPWSYGYDPELYRRAGEVRPEPPTMRIIVEHVNVPPPPAAVPVAPAATLPAAIPPAPPGHKRTLYVIPGCYAGDKLPRADQLPAGCSLRNVRTISPVL
jgi:hypothetical protein